MKYLKLKPMAETMLKDTLYNMDSHSGASTEYSKGLVVGVVGTLMAAGFKFDDAIDTIAQYMPNKRTTRLTVPPSWEHRLSACLLARGKMLDE